MTSGKYDNLLAIDTSTKRLVLAAAYGGDRLVKSDNVVEKSHGQIILKKISELLESSALTTEQLNGIVVSIGPGSFTGLRIGLAAAKGLAVARDIPIIGVSLFEVATFVLSGRNEPACVLIPSRRGEWYVSPLLEAGSEIGDVRVVPTERLAEETVGQPVYLIGAGSSSETLQGIGVDVRGELGYDGSHLIAVGKARLCESGPDDTASLEPLYYQKAVAEVRFEQRQKRKDNSA